MIISMSPRAQYTQRAPKIIKIMSFKGSRGVPGGDILSIGLLLIGTLETDFLFKLADHGHFFPTHFSLSPADPDWPDRPDFKRFFCVFDWFCLLFPRTLKKLSKSYTQIQNHKKNIGQVTKSNDKSNFFLLFVALSLLFVAFCCFFIAFYRFFMAHRCFLLLFRCLLLLFRCFLLLFRCLSLLFVAFSLLFVAFCCFFISFCCFLLICRCFFVALCCFFIAFSLLFVALCCFVVVFSCFFVAFCCFFVALSLLFQCFPMLFNAFQCLSTLF